MDTGTWGLYYNYTWWGNAIQTAPSVIGKPDFFGSQFEMLTSQQPNQVVNGDFVTDSDWNLLGGWSIANGKLTANTATGYALQTGVFESGVSKTYKINLSVSDYVSGYFTILTSGGTAQSQQFSANGNYTIYFDTNSPSGTTLHFTYFGSFTGSIDNVSVQLVRADNVEAVKCIADWIHETQILDV